MSSAARSGSFDCYFHFRFVGLTIQKTGLLSLFSSLNDESDKWRLEVYKGSGLGDRGGILTVEGGGRLDVRNLDFRAHRCEVDVDGWINLDRQGFNQGRSCFGTSLIY